MKHQKTGERRWNKHIKWEIYAPKAETTFFVKERTTAMPTNFRSRGLVGRNGSYRENNEIPTWLARLQH